METVTVHHVHRNVFYITKVDGRKDKLENDYYRVNYYAPLSFFEGTTDFTERLL